MKCSSLLFIALSLVAIGCAKSTTASSEPVGKFESEVTLNEAESERFASCGIQEITASLDFSCSVMPDSIETQTDKVETGLYTFTVNDQIVPSLRITRTVSASVVCKDENNNLIPKGTATETTVVIYASKEDVSQEKACASATPVWMMKKVEAGGQLIEKDTHQLLQTFTQQALLGVFSQ